MASPERSGRFLPGDPRVEGPYRLTPQMALRVENASRDINPFTNLQSYAMGWNVQDYRGELLVAQTLILGTEPGKRGRRGGR